MIRLSNILVSVHNLVNIIHICELDPSNHFDDVRLQGSNSVGRNPSQGRLEYFRNFEWHTVCYADFNQTEADVACRMLGFRSAKKFQKYVCI